MWRTGEMEEGGGAPGNISSPVRHAVITPVGIDWGFFLLLAGILKLNVYIQIVVL